MRFYRFELTVIDACSLENVRRSGRRMEVYAVVSLSSGNGKKSKPTKRRIPADKNGDINPAWNYTVEYYVGESAAQQHGLMVEIKLKCKRPFLRDNRYIGQVHVAMKDLFVNGDGLETQLVKKGSQVSMGSLRFSYRFEGPVSKPKRPFWKKGFLGAGKTIFSVIVSTAAGILLQIPISH